jgi:thiamine biosynthesis lipoprotein
MQPFTKSWKALGTWVHVLTTTPEGLGPAEAAVHNVLEDVDQTYSRFRHDSELSRLNAHPDRVVRVGLLMATALEVAVRAARVSQGAVDPTVGKALRQAGYDDDFDRLAGKAALPSAEPASVPGWQTIRFDPRSRTVCLPEGVELDFGSTGKALAADLAAAYALKAMRSGGVLVSLGGDIATAGGPPVGGWRILVAEDSNTPPDGEGETISILGGGLATSSTTVRRWTRASAVLHHIIDPSTGLPATGPWRTVTVAAASCVDANVASTAAIVRGESAVDWLVGQGLPARLVRTDGTVHYVGRWPAPKGVAA